MKTLVLGASENPERYSHMAVKKLIAAGHEVVAIGSRPGAVDTVPIQTDMPAVTDIHTVTMYLHPDNQQDYFDYIPALKPQRVIFNPGAENEALEQLLRQAGITTIRACTLVLLNTGQF